MAVKRVGWVAWTALFLLTAVLQQEAYGETTVGLSDVPEDIIFPLPKGRNLVLTATVEGGKARWVWLAQSRDSAGRVMMTAVGGGKYQINLADPIVSAVLCASERKGQFRVFVETEEGQIVASIPVCCLFLDVASFDPPRYYVHVDDERTEVFGYPTSDMTEQLARAAQYGEMDMWELLFALEALQRAEERVSVFAPDEVDAVEVRFTPDRDNPSAEAETDGKTWPFGPAERPHCLVLKMDADIRQAWKANRILTVQSASDASEHPPVTLKAMPHRLDLSGKKHRMNVYQRSSKALPGSDGCIRMHLEDITGGQVGLSILTEDGQAIVEETSVRTGDEAWFRVGDCHYRLSVVRLVNFLFDEDYGTFTISELPPDELEGLRPELAEIEALMDIVEESDVTFIRAGDEHTAKKAARHMHDKFDRAKPWIHTVNYFIDKVAGVSWTTGEEYEVKLPDGTVVGAKIWLREQAEKPTVGNENSS